MLEITQTKLASETAIVIESSSSLQDVSVHVATSTCFIFYASTKKKNPFSQSRSRRGNVHVMLYNM